MSNDRKPLRMLLLSLALLSGAAAAQDIARERQDETYWIQGRDLASLRAALEAAGPRDDGGQRHHGLARTGLGWTYGFQPEGRQCRIRDARVLLKVAMVLPLWGTEVAHPPRW